MNKQKYFMSVHGEEITKKRGLSLVEKQVFFCKKGSFLTKIRLKNKKMLICVIFEIFSFFNYS